MSQARTQTRAGQHPRGGTTAPMTAHPTDPAPERTPASAAEPEAEAESGPPLRIGQLAERTGVSVRLLRYYGQQGLLTPRRLGNGYRVYAEDDVRLVRYIRSLLAAGLTTAVIGRLLPSVCERDGVLRPCTPELADELRRERDRIDAQVAELLASRRLLEEVIEAAPRHAP
ncbi:MerR family transcriptional regulator [Streptomyces buecherae]|uniref:MerR family transcriptional regulator n=1 Tax=Streptomyces buecherae TaxID=2763006 RepID=UPI0027E14C94|nr:MerR family transcriptional regulator [Streptomyces buecherae]